MIKFKTNMLRSIANTTYVLYRFCFRDILHRMLSTNSNTRLLAPIILSLIIATSLNLYAETYYVSTSGDDTNPGTINQPWKTINYSVSTKSPIQPGDIILVRSGTYKEEITVLKSGAQNNQFILKNYPDEHPIITGSSSIANWTLCTNSTQAMNDADGNLNPNYSNIYYSIFPKSYIGSFNNPNLFENGTPLFIAHAPHQEDPLIFSDKYFYTINNANSTWGQNKFISDTTNLNQTSSNYWEGCLVQSYYGYNHDDRIGPRVNISHFDPTLNKIFLEKTDNRLFAAGDKYTIINHTSFINRPGTFALKEYDNDNYIVYLWPHERDSFQNSIQAMKLKTAFLSKEQSHFTIEGFDIEYFTNTAIEIRGSSHDAVTIANNNIHDVRGNAIIIASGKNDVINGNIINHINSGSGIACLTSGGTSHPQNVMVSNNTIENTASSAIYFSGVNEGTIYKNTIGAPHGTHNSGITVYGNASLNYYSENITVANNIAPYLRMRAVKDCLIINNILSNDKIAPFAHWVNESAGTIKILNNILIPKNGEDAIYGSFLDPHLDKLIISNNILTSLPKGALSKAEHSYNIYLSELPDIPNNSTLITNPDTLFIDFENNNFNHTTNSPAINAGVDLSHFIPTNHAIRSKLFCDINEFMRDGSPDISCYEYNSSKLKSEFLLQTTRDGYGTVERTPNKYFFNPNESVQLYAKADSGYTFAAWEGDVNSQKATIDIQMSNDKLLNSNFLDTTGPVITNVLTLGLNRILVQFDEAIKISSITTSNINISNNIIVQNIELKNEKEIILNTNTQQVLIPYAIDIKNTEDIFGNFADNTYQYYCDNPVIGHLSFDNPLATLDDSAYKHKLKMYGTQSDSGLVNQSVHFDGQSYIRIPVFHNLNNTNRATISFFAKQDSLGSNYYALWAANNLLISFGDSGNNNSVRVKWHLNESWGTNHLVENVIDLGIWAHWCFVFNEGETKIYKNSNLIYSGTDSKSNLSSNVNIYPIYDIGYRTKIGGYKGNLDEFKIYNYALSESEIQKIANVNNQNTPPTLSTISNRTITEQSSLAIILSATDADGDPITYSANNMPAGSSLTNNQFFWTPTTSQGSATPYTLTFIASDGNGGTASQNVNITVLNANQSPVFLQHRGVLSTEGQKVTIALIATDDDSGLIYSCNNMPAGDAQIVNNIFTWTPNYFQAASYSFKFTVTDTGGLTDTTTIPVEITNINQKPVFEGLTDHKLDNNESIRFIVTASDKDFDTLSYQISGKPVGATYSGGTFTWSPANDVSGIFDVIFTVSDGKDSVSETVSISVNMANSAPKLDPIGDKVIAENEALHFSVTATDVDNDTINYRAENLPHGAFFSEQQFRWTPRYDQAGTYSVTFIASDPLISDRQTVSFAVTDVNRAPVLTTISDQNIKENSPVSINISATDPDNDTPLTITSSSMPAGAIFANNLFQWQPPVGVIGAQVITFTVTDGKASSSQDVTIMITKANVSDPETPTDPEAPTDPVTPTNSAPIIAPISPLRYIVDTAYALTIKGSDKENSALTYSAASIPLNATFSGNIFTWTPNIDNIGVYNIHFTVSDGELSTTQTVKLTVTEAGVNTPPVFAIIDAKSISEAESITFAIHAKDLDEDPITFSVKNPPSGASFVGNTFSWTPNYDAAGNYDVTFIASDGIENSETNVSITVTNTNRAPMFTLVSRKTVTLFKQIQFTLNASDPDNDNIIYSAINLPAGATLNGNRFKWTPKDETVESVDVTFIASDGTEQVSRTTKFSIIAHNTDETAPEINFASPENNDIQVALNTLISFEISDDNSGIDEQSVQIKCNNKVIYSGDTKKFVSESGVCRRSGATTYYKYTFQPTGYYNPDEQVQITIDAADLAGNIMPQYRSTFLTQMHTFGGAVIVNRDQTNQNSHNPTSITSSDGTTWVIWEESGTQNTIYAATKNKNKSNFSEAFTISNSSNHQSNPMIVSNADNTVYIVWEEKINGLTNILVAYALENSHIFSTPKILSDTSTNQSSPNIAIDQATDYLMAITWVNIGQQIQIANSTDGFATHTTLNVTTVATPVYNPVVAIASGVTSIFWTSQTNDTPVETTIFGASSAGHFSPVTIVASNGKQQHPSVSADTTGKLHLCWEDKHSGNTDIYYATTTGQFESLPLTGINIIDDSSASDQKAPSVTTSLIDNKVHIYASWEDHRNTTVNSDDYDIYFRELNSASNTNIIVTNEPTNASQQTSHIAAGIDQFPYIVWIDSRNKKDMVYFSGATNIAGQRLESEEISSKSGGTVGTPFDDIDSTDDVSVEIPTHAFWNDTQITINEIIDPTSTESFESFFSSYEFGPSSDMEFAKPVKITIPFEMSDNSETADAFWYNPDTGTLSQYGISNIEVIHVKDTLYAMRFETTHFSQYMVGIKSPESKDNPLGGSSGSDGCSISKFSHTPGSIMSFILPYGILLCIWLLIKFNHRRHN